MAGTDREGRSRRSRLPIMPMPRAEHPAARRAAALTRAGASDDSIYTLRGYKAWAARVKAAWDAES
jgi:hypothetical protein